MKLLRKAGIQNFRAALDDFADNSKLFKDFLEQAGFYEKAVHQRTPESLPRRLYGSLDAAKVRIEPRAAAEKQAESEAWRDLKVGYWYEAEPVPLRQRSNRQREVTA